MLLPRSARSWSRRKPTSAALQLLAFFFFLLFLHTRVARLPVQDEAVRKPGADRPKSPLLQHQAAFWKDLYQIILNNDPHCEHLPEIVVPHKLDIGFDPSHNHPRPDVLWMEPADIKHMQEAHSNFVHDIKRSPPRLVYEPNTRGIVMTAGYLQLPVLVTSLRMLRRTGSLLPVEVFLADGPDYDDDVCDQILPSLNAKCLLLSDVFQAAKSGLSIDHYQYKIMAVLFSSFEQVLLLDSDAFPLHDPLSIFGEEPFNTTGMVVWPDFWYASESPYYFEIAKLDTVPALHTRASMESGEILYSKSQHALSIMLATYYNFYGPMYYYPLLSQGAPGEGDKETFAWAATVFGEPFHAVRDPVKALGRLDSSGTFLGSAMVQHDPSVNFAREPNTRGASDHSDLFSSHVIAPRPLFIHANFPKFDPSTIFTEGNDRTGIGGPTRDSNGTSIRCWMDKEKAIERFGFDVEYRFWEEIRGTACEYERHFGCWKGKEGICKRVTKYWYDVFEPIVTRQQEHSL
ncbi:hypothetical protein LTR84_005530 [Exophiala bonariae]|uniref:Alpha-1,2-mannosyltransferase n=1 Tax=Exophiala bonariae TaxID=1690606 RepID=A0AAV9N8D9_9EURO|nr:hypothetical protein LTR84_005530 [Exophiala bonariae]